MSGQLSLTGEAPHHTPRDERGRCVRDGFFTPDTLAMTIVARATGDFGAHGPALEPSAGGGAFVRAMAQEPSIGHVTAVDLEPATDLRAAGAGTVHVGDFLDYHPERAFRLIAGNPPFRDAQRHVEHALSLLVNRGALVFLLRLAFLESLSRVEFWRRHHASLRYVDVMHKRPSFTGGGTDSCAYGVFSFQNGYDGPTEQRFLEW